jgi:DNA-directed RNA polymerase specialized sigma24 family protein
MDDWMAELRRGNSDAAWDLFIARYRRVIFAGIHHYARDPDDAMDIFAWVCEALREDDLYRLRRYAEQTGHKASASTWLVTVVRHLTVDWFRHRDGRRHLSLIAEDLPPLQRRIFELVYLDHHPYVEAYELIRTTAIPDLTFAQFLAELRATHETVTTGRHGRVVRAMVGRQPNVPSVQSPSTGETAERRAVLGDAVRALSTGERKAVDLYVIDGRPAGTVATMLGLPNAKAVYNRVYRALDVLRERLEKAGIRRGDL